MQVSHETIYLSLYLQGRSALRQTRPSWLAWDQGRAMKRQARFASDAGVQVYFCRPRRPWQGGSNENTNGLLRQYFPKGKTVAGYSQEDLDHVAAELNDRPRETLGWESPATTLAQFLTASLVAGVAPTP